jgi:hypothetical protein
MVKIFSSQKHVFWIAFILTIFVFSAGVFLGYQYENLRTREIISLYKQSELSLLDIKIQNEVYSLSDINCENAIKENINFGDRIYEEAKTLVRYENAQRITDELRMQHKKYDLLRTLFWINSVKIKERCNADYSNVVYLYDYNEPGMDKTEKQSVFSKLLSDLKKEKGNNILLIPIAGDNNFTSTNLMMSVYNVTEQELPVILIDEKHKITEFKTLEELKELVD